VCTIAYIFAHNLFSQNRLRYLKSHDSTTKPFRQSKYIAVRLVGLNALLWLCAAGWGLVNAARRPICLRTSRENPVQPPSWEAGTPCTTHRTVTAIAVVMLYVAFFAFTIHPNGLSRLLSCVQFGIIQIAKRPFDSHLLGRIDTENYDSEASSPSNSTTNLHDTPKMTKAPRSRLSSLPPQLPSPLDLPLDLPPIPPAFRERSHVIDPPMSPKRSMSSLHPSQRSNPVIYQPSLTPADLPGIHRSVAQSRVALAHPRPIRRIPSASSLMANHPAHKSLHRRSLSAGSLQNLHRAHSHSQLVEYRGSLSLMRTPQPPVAPSQYAALHPPQHHFRHSAYPRLTRAGTVAVPPSRTSMPMAMPPRVRRARTSVIVPARHSRIPPSGWGHIPLSPRGGGFARPQLHRKTSSLSSSSSGYGKGSISTSQLSDHVEEDEEGTDGTSVSGEGSIGSITGSMKGTLAKLSEETIKGVNTGPVPLNLPAIPPEPKDVSEAMDSTASLGTMVVRKVKSASALRELRGKKTRWKRKTILDL